MQTKHLRQPEKVIDDQRIETIRRRRSSFFFYRFILWLPLLVAFGSVAVTHGAETAAVPSYGKGPVELIVFTDYFCPPCAMIETDLGPAILKLMARGRVKVTFVDIPGHGKDSVLYAKYFLFSTQGAPGYKNAMHARDVLFDLARQNTVKTDAEVEQTFTAKGVAFKAFNTKPVYAEWDKAIKRYKIRTTPTCILKYSETNIRTYTGTVEIRNHLLPELKALAKNSKL